jgi:hypothetical protein
MLRCESCGNKYNLFITVERNGIKHCFDCFECAIHKLAPYCERCNVRVIGHGVQFDGVIFCSRFCAKQARKKSLQYEPNTSEDNWEADIGKGPNRDQPQIYMVSPGPV